MPLEPCAGIGLRDHSDQAGVQPVRDEGLRTVDHVVVAVPDRARADRLQVGACARFGHRDRTDEFARGHARQPVALLGLVAVVEHVVRDDAVHGVTEAGDAVPAHLLRDDGLVPHVAADAPVLRRDVRAEQADLARLVPDLAVDVVLFAPACIVRHDLVFHEPAHGLAVHVQLVVQPGGAVCVHLGHLVSTRITTESGVIVQTQLALAPGTGCQHCTPLDLRGFDVPERRPDADRTRQDQRAHGSDVRRRHGRASHVPRTQRPHQPARQCAAGTGFPAGRTRSRA